MIKMILSYFFRECVWKTFRICPYAQRQHIFCVFGKRKLILIFLKKFWIFFKENFRRKSSIFNIGFVSYNISLQPDIMKNSWKNMLGAHKYFKMSFGKFEFFLKIIFLIFFYYYMGLARPSHIGWVETSLAHHCVVIGPA